MIFVWNLALAHHYAGNFLQAVKLWRKCLASGQEELMSSKKLEGGKKMICIAQLCLPGMELEDYKILSKNSDLSAVTALHKDNLDWGRVVKAQHPDGSFAMAMTPTPGGSQGANCILVDVPKDPNDREAWPSALFALLSRELEPGSLEYKAASGR